MKGSLKFWKKSGKELMLHLDTDGGFLVVPSAPSLCQTSKDATLLRAHLEADHAVVDSGYLWLLLACTGNYSLPRISGHQLMEIVLAPSDESSVPFRQRTILWVVPDPEEQNRIARLLTSLDFKDSNQHYYQAPHYVQESDFQDEALVESVASAKPDWIVLCIGGGRQEKLGAYLRGKLGRRPVILATGGAVSFFTGGQASIPRLGDRLFLGWFFRIMDNPRRFLPRYVQALSLPLALWRINRSVARRSWAS